MDEPICQVAGCGRNEAAHRTMAHQFQPDVELLRRRETARGTQITAADAILRVTLLRRGIITQEDLAETEKELKAAGLLGGANARDRQDGGPDREGGTREKSERGVRSRVR